MKILLLDIETAPNLAYVWGLWEQNINTSHIVDNGYVLCWAAKWLGEDKVMFDSIYESSEKQMLKGVHKLLDEADVVVHYNGRSFDIPTLNKEFLLNKMTPPAPYKQIDLLQVVRREFRFQSNKLDFISKTLGHQGKHKHGGFQLWVDCMAMKPAAWKEMRTYNIGDVVELEKVYMDVRPWIKNHPNRNSYDGDGQCPVCGGKHYQQRGPVPHKEGYRRAQCMTKGCGKWFEIAPVDSKSKVKFREAR